MMSRNRRRQQLILDALRVHCREERTRLHREHRREASGDFVERDVIADIQRMLAGVAETESFLEDVGAAIKVER